MPAPNDRIQIHVRSAGRFWNETWSASQLAYFILMSELAPPKFDIAQATEWIPLDQNQYKWDKSVMTKPDFDLLKQAFPRSEKRVFEKAHCDKISLSFVDQNHVGALLFDRLKYGWLIDFLIDVCDGDMSYLEFDYYSARHVFHSMLDQEKVSRLKALGPQVVVEFKRVHSALAAELQTGRLVGRPLVFKCRDNDFESPLSIWYEA